MEAIPAQRRVSHSFDTPGGVPREVGSLLWEADRAGEELPVFSLLSLFDSEF